MAMANKEYWAERFRQLEESQHRSSEKLVEEIQQEMRKAEAEIEKKIEAWYGRLAANNGISMVEARKLLNARELAEFHWDVNTYIKYGEENAINQKWMKQLENASARVHISRLEQLKLQVQQETERLYGNYLDSVDRHVKSLYEEGFYKTAYEIQKGVGVGWNLTGVDSGRLDKLIRRPWAADGKNFSERIWSSKQQLIENVHTSLTQMCILGQDPGRTIDSLAKAMGTSKSQAGRLVMTESAFFGSEARKDCFQELGVEQYKIVATLDSHTSEICQEMDGKVFPMSEYASGSTAPPFHVWCRTTTVPDFGDEFDKIGERAARGEDGKTYYVPASMTYPEWKEKFVDGGDKSGLDVYNQDGVTHYKKSALKESETSATIIDMRIQDVTEEYLKKSVPGKGTLAYEAGYQIGSHGKEVEIGKWVHETLGGDIVLLLEAIDCNKKTPDYTWNGKAWELKSISSAKAADSALRTAAKQIQEEPGGIILELVDDIDMDDLEKVLSGRFRRVHINELDILMVAQGMLKKVLRYKK